MTWRALSAWPYVQATRDAIVANLTHSAGYLEAYLALYDEYLPLLQKDVKAYIDELKENKELTLEDLLKEIATHEKHLVYVTTMVPNSISVGAFSLSTRKVRETLVAKRHDLAEQVKLLVADFPRRVCEKVNAEFKQINKQLAIKTTDPEGIKAQRELIESLPKLVAELNEVLDTAYPYFDALDKMARPLVRPGRTVFAHSAPVHVHPPPPLPAPPLSKGRSHPRPHPPAM